MRKHRTMVQTDCPEPLRAAPEHESEAVLQISGQVGRRALGSLVVRPPWRECWLTGLPSAASGAHRTHLLPPKMAGSSLCFVPRHSGDLWADRPQVTEKQQGLPPLIPAGALRSFDPSGAGRGTCSIRIVLLNRLKQESSPVPRARPSSGIAVMLL